VADRLDVGLGERLQWVKGYGHIEIGNPEGLGLVVRAIDSGSVAFGDDEPTTLAGATAAPERGLAGWFEEQRSRLIPNPTDA
jgi:hypothetical protein